MDDLTTVLLLVLVVVVLVGGYTSLNRLANIDKHVASFRHQFSMTFTPYEEKEEEGYSGYPKDTERHLSHIVTLLEHIALAQGVPEDRIKEVRNER